MGPIGFFATVLSGNANDRTQRCLSYPYFRQFHFVGTIHRCVRFRSHAASVRYLFCSNFEFPRLFISERRTTRAVNICDRHLGFRKDIRFIL